MGGHHHHKHDKHDHKHDGNCDHSSTSAVSSHAHSHSEADDKSRKLTLMASLTATLFFLELIVGYQVGSLALVSDAFHMLSDLASLLVALFAIKLSQKEKSESLTFGYVRAEVLGGLINAVFLLAVCMNIIIEAVQRFFEVTEVTSPQLLIGVASAGLMFNIIGLFIFSGHHHHHHDHDDHDDHGHGHSHGNDNKKEHKHKHDKKKHSHEHAAAESSVSESESSSDLEISPISIDFPSMPSATTPPPELAKKKTSSMAMHSVFLHVLGDAMASVAVIVSGLFMWKTDFSWRFYVDPLISLVISVFIIRSSWPLLKHSSMILLQSVPRSIRMTRLRREILAIAPDNVLGIHELHIYQLDEAKSVGSMHITVSNSSDFMTIAPRIKAVLHKYNVHSTTIQPEYVTPEQQQALKLAKSRRRLRSTSGKIANSSTSPAAKSSPPAGDDGITVEVASDAASSFTLEEGEIIAAVSKRHCYMKCDELECAEQVCCDSGDDMDDEDEENASLLSRPHPSPKVAKK